MVAVTKADELVTVLPLMSSSVAVNAPPLPPEITVVGTVLLIICAAAQGVNVTTVEVPVRPGLLSATV